MRPLTTLTGRVAVLDRADVDTDQIMPKQFLKRIERSGYGQFLFFDWAKDPGFELNRPEFQGAQVLITGRNFGCGSSREHAAWGLEDAGFRVVIAPSFGDIFRANAVKNGMAPIELGEAALTKLKEAVSNTNELTIDLEQLEIIHPGGLRVSFELDPYSRETLLHGLDDIARTLTREAKISAYEAAHAARYDARVLSG